MSATPPQEAAEFRGNSHTPVSPKPSYFPCPANIPILEAQVDEAAMQTFASNAGPAVPSLAGHVREARPNGKPATDAQAIDSAQDDEGSSDGFVQIEEPAAQYRPHNDTLHAADAAPLSQAPAQSAQSEAFDVGGHSSPSGQPTHAQPIARPGTGQPPNKPQSLSSATLDLDALLAGIEKQAQATASDAPALDSAVASASASSPTPKPEISTLPPNPNLPPKPPAQDPTSQPNYTPSNDIRSYHPHSQKEASAPYRASLPNLNTNSLPQPPHPYPAPLPSTFANPSQSPAASNFGQRDGTPMNDDEDMPLDPRTQRLYDQFLQFERQNVADGQWDRFAVGSRLFIGNLPTEKVTKKDIFRRFYKYGQLAQISLKQAYGFVQFLDAETCHRALSAEQGLKIRGREMHLEISKPQKNTRTRDGAGETRGGTRRRSRSPDYNRGGNQAPRGVDRYTSGSQISPRDRDYRRGGRDDFRRSPSPRAGRRGTIDRYDGRRRSRSRTPPHGRGARHQSAPRGVDDSLPLPRRAPQEVPDVQIIIADDLDRQFIQWVDTSIQARGLRVNVLMLAPHLSDEAVIKRQILEGVQAVVRLSRVDQTKGKIPLQVFDRRGGHHNVQFEQYEDLDPNIAAELVVRAKQTHGAPAPQVTYGLPPAGPPAGYGLPPQQQPSSAYGYRPPVHQQPPPNPYANPYGSPPAAVAPPQHYPPPGPTSSRPPGPDLARILGQLGTPSQPQPQPQDYSPRPQQPPYAPTQQYAPPQPQYSAPLPPPPAQQQQAGYGSSSLAAGEYAGGSGVASGQQDIQALLANLSAYKPPN